MKLYDKRKNKLIKGDLVFIIKPKPGLEGLDSSPGWVEPDMNIYNGAVGRINAILHQTVRIDNWWFHIDWVIKIEENNADD